jgi:nucleotide-binding universal stress UspA family protein
MDRTVSGIAVDRLAAAVLAQLDDGRPEIHVDPQWGVVEVTTPSRPDGAVVAAAVTGAASSCAVVRYAHHRARSLGLPLRVAHTWNRRTPEATDVLLTSILYDCLSPSDAAAAEREILHDRDVGRALRALSNEARLHAHCPVAVVRGRPDPSLGPVAVGVDDSPAADTVLETAFSAAAERHTGLVAVRSYSPGPATPLGRIPVSEIETPEQDAVERLRLNAQLALWHAKHPDVPVEIVVSRDSPAAMLVEMSHGTQLVVVGNHGHGLLTSTLLGSTSLHLLRHSHCPVLVVRGGQTPGR